MKETFGEYIHNLRIANGLTLTKLAASLDIDQSTLSKIENHKRKVPEEILPKLAKVFKLDISVLKREYNSERIAEFSSPQCLFFKAMCASKDIAFKQQMLSSAIKKFLSEGKKF